MTTIAIIDSTVGLHPAGPRRADPRLERIADALAHGELHVSVLPWHELRFASVVSVRRPGSDDLHRTCLAGPEAPLRPDALLFFPAARPGTPTTADERTALRELALPAAASRWDRNHIAARLLLTAAGARIVTNAPGADGRWGRKDQLELMLRAYTRTTGRRVPRPETYVIDSCQAPRIVASVARSGGGWIVKPANGARGEGVQCVVSPDPCRRPPRHLARARSGGKRELPMAGDVIIQRLGEPPRLVNGSKFDLRCYVMIDTYDVRRSMRLKPVLVRIAARPYRRGCLDAELTNTSHRRRLGLAPDIQPLAAVAGLAPEVRREIADRLDVLVAEFLRAHAWWSANRVCDRPAGRRLLIWGLDVLPVVKGTATELMLLEVNAHPQLLRGSALADASVRHMLRDTYVPKIIEAIADERSATQRPNSSTISCASAVAAL